jgi:small subunit ribosomal protein S16
MGAKKKPFYRLVVADARSPRDGRFIEAVGVYDPLANPALVRLDADRIKDWISKGARPTDVARQLLVSEGVLERTGPVYDPAGARPKASKKAQAKAAAAAAAPPDAPAAPPAEAPADVEKTTSTDSEPSLPSREAGPEPTAPAEQPAAAPAEGEAEAPEASR